MSLRIRSRVSIDRGRLPAGLMLGLLVAGILGCSDARDSLDDGQSPAESVLATDGMNRLRAELEQADRDFAKRVRDGRLEAWVGTFAEDGMVLPENGPVATGPSAIRSFYAPLFADPGFAIDWTPSGAEVASSGDFGYTFGVWTSSTPTADGTVDEARGKYVTVWQRDSQGNWRVLADIGNTQRGSG